MFRKVLKYDINAIIKLWSVFTATVLLLGVIGGLSFRGMTAASNAVGQAATAQMAFIPLYVLGIFLSIVAIAAYGVGTLVIVMVRFYKNFFSDEGYLTFTLPVKRSTLFNSKLLSAFIFTVASAIVTVISLTVLLAIAPGGELGGSALSVVVTGISDLLRDIYMIMQMENAIAFWISAFVIAGVLWLVTMFVYETLLLFCTVTFGSLLVKKAKVITSIGIYYAAQTVMSMVMAVLQMLLSVGITALAEVPYVIEGTQILWLILGIIIMYTCMLGLLAALLYKFAVNKLRGNLNLA